MASDLSWAPPGLQGMLAYEDRKEAKKSAKVKRDYTKALTESAAVQAAKQRAALRDFQEAAPVRRAERQKKLSDIKHYMENADQLRAMEMQRQQLSNRLNQIKVSDAEIEFVQQSVPFLMQAPNKDQALRYINQQYSEMTGKPLPIDTSQGWTPELEQQLAAMYQGSAEVMEHKRALEYVNTQMATARETLALERKKLGLEQEEELRGKTLFSLLNSQDPYKSLRRNEDRLRKAGYSPRRINYLKGLNGEELRAALQEEYMGTEHYFELAQKQSKSDRRPLASRKLTNTDINNAKAYATSIPAYREMFENLGDKDADRAYRDIAAKTEHILRTSTEAGNPIPPDEAYHMAVDMVSQGIKDNPSLASWLPNFATDAGADKIYRPEEVPETAGETHERNTKSQKDAVEDIKKKTGVTW